MSRLIRFSIFCALVLSPLAAMAETYRIDRGHSSVEFSIRHMVSKVTGQFDEFSGQIVYDAEAPEKSSVEVTIQSASINTVNERRDNHLRSDDFFEV
jgi:polyisoprenoid-binding protein YceI